MKITFLGSGTSSGVPFIGCGCPVCTSTDPRDKRWRSSILIEKGNTKVVVDTGYEFRLQCIRAGIDGVDGVLYTHTHPDHLVGLDDLRAFCRSGNALDIYASREHLDRIESSFPYAFRPPKKDGLPHLRGNEVVPGKPFTVGEIEFIPFSVSHGCRNVTAFRFGNAAYVTDVKDIRMDENRKYLENLDLLIIDGLMEGSHPTHYSFDEALEKGEEVKARRIYFTHISHSLTHVMIEEKYRNRAKPAYDTLVLEVNDV